MATGEAVMVSLDELKECQLRDLKGHQSRPNLCTASVSFEILEKAFGPSSLGILIVKDLPGQYLNLRRRLLSFASLLAVLPSHVLGISPCIYLFSMQ